jgi:hypothetical protein
MDRQVIFARRRPPVFAVLWGVATLVLLVAGMALRNPHLELLALAAAAPAIGLWCFRPAEFQAELTEAGLCLPRPQQEIAYARIESVTLAGLPQDPEGKLKEGPLVVMHEDGVLEIPARLNLPAADLYRMLVARAGGAGSGRIHPELSAFYENEVRLFGAPRVRTFAARRHLGRKPSTRRSQACFALWALVGVSWLVLPLALLQGPRDDVAPWIGCGILLLLVGGFGWLIAALRQRNLDAKLARWHESSIVVGPSGIGLVQGDLKGQLRWDELVDLRVGVKTRQFALTSGQLVLPGLHLIVAGAEIRIADVYDHPLPQIAALLRQYWRGPAPK